MNSKQFNRHRNWCFLNKVPKQYLFTRYLKGIKYAHIICFEKFNTIEINGTWPFFKNLIWNKYITLKKKFTGTLSKIAFIQVCPMLFLTEQDNFHRISVSNSQGKNQCQFFFTKFLLIREINWYKFKKSVMRKSHVLRSQSFWQ